jgi:heptosyltransferase-2|tara:strand:+ start:324 stop:1337 length:1014 start_codon:yes stop_codon:yes gene_type:complete
MDILIIKLGAIGDVLRTTAILPGLREKYPDSLVTWVTKADSFDILKNNEFIDKLHLIQENLAEKFKDVEFDLVINLDDDLEACKLASSLRSKKIIGTYLDDDKKVYTDDSSSWFEMGLISKFGKEKADELKALNKKTYQSILFDILGIENKDYEPQLNLQNEDIRFGKKFLERNEVNKKALLIGINTGAGGRWQDKKLSVEQTVELIKKLDDEVKNKKLILFGGPEEKERNKEILEKSDVNVIDAGCENTLMEFASLVNLCKILITSDSLAMHIGIALKKKVICFFYSTSSSEIELYNRGIKIIGKGEDYCSYKPKCDIPPKWNIDDFIDGVKKLSS